MAALHPHQPAMLAQHHVPGQAVPFAALGFFDINVAAAAAALSGRTVGQELAALVAQRAAAARISMAVAAATLSGLTVGQELALMDA